MSEAASRLMKRAADVRENEAAPVLWSCAYFFFILTSYYILRPIRENMGVAGGVENLAWLFTGTLAGMLLLHPFYTWLVSRLPRKRFVPLTYRFFILNLIVFFFVFRAVGPEQTVWVGRVFFIWTSVFNLFVVSVFWSFMTDLYRPQQSKRLFGMVAVGGTLGAMLGSAITSALVPHLGPVNLLLVSALFLEIAGRASGVLDRHEEKLAQSAADEEAAGNDAEGRHPRSARESRPAGGHGSSVIGGGVLEGIRHVLRSPYMLGIAVLMLFFTISSTFLYFQQADITDRMFGDDSEGRTRLFANIDFIVNALTLVTQLFLTGRILRWLGVTAGLVFLPLLGIVGFGVFGAAPLLAVFVVHQVVRRAGNFAIQRPAREVLYTVLARTDKYKAKNFNDTFVYRLGDQFGAWSYTFVMWLGMSISGLSFLMVPFSAVWLLLAIWLGRKYAVIQRHGHDDAAAPRKAEAAARAV